MNGRTAKPRWGERLVIIGLLLATVIVTLLFYEARHCYLVKHSADDDPLVFAPPAVPLKMNPGPDTPPAGAATADGTNPGRSRPAASPAPRPRRISSTATRSASPPDDPALVEFRRQQVREAEAKRALPADSAEYWEDDPGLWKYVTRPLKRIHAIASRAMPGSPGVTEGRRGTDSAPRNAY